jgi:plastocyanin
MTALLVAGAPTRATMTLAAEAVLGLGLLVGAVFARRGQYRLHQYWQSAIVLLNVLLIVAVMAPSFAATVLPQGGSSLGDRFYAVAVLHGALGLALQALSVYVILAAGTNLLPTRWRVRRLKVLMRSTLALWWLVLLAGAGVYSMWYVGASDARAVGGIPSRRLVALRDFHYQPRDITVVAGSTVLWRGEQGVHTVHADGGAFRSSPLTPGAGFRYTFRRPGTYAYHCDFHGAAGGVGMSGRIVVLPRRATRTGT